MKFMVYIKRLGEYITRYSDGKTSRATYLTSICKGVEEQVVGKVAKRQILLKATGNRKLWIVMTRHGI